MSTEAPPLPQTRTRARKHRTIDPSTILITVHGVGPDKHEIREEFGEALLRNLYSYAELGIKPGNTAVQFSQEGHPTTGVTLELLGCLKSDARVCRALIRELPEVVKAFLPHSPRPNILLGQ